MAANRTIILDEGINAIHSGTFGPYFALKYFLPMYDPTIDDDIHDATQSTTSADGVEVLQLSAALESGTATYSSLKGEKLFNTLSDVGYIQEIWPGTTAGDTWFITDTRNYVVSATPNVTSLGSSYTDTISSDSTGISATSFSQGTRVNVISGTNGTSAISDILSGTDLVADGSGGFTGTSIALIPKVTEPSFALAPNGQNTSATSLLYSVKSFSRVAVSGTNVDSGRYAVELTSIHGDFRFNKIVMFASKVDSNGNEDTTVMPIPFSVHVFEGTIPKRKTTSTGSGLVWEGLFQITFARDPSVNDLTSLQVSNWTDLGVSAKQLASDDKVTIFAGTEGMPVTDAKLEVFGNGLSAANPTVSTSGWPQLALGHDNNNYAYLGTSADNTLYVSANDMTFNTPVSFNDEVYINDTSNDLSLYLYSDNSQSVIISAYYDLTIDADNDILIQRPTYFSGLINVTGPATFNSSTTFNNEVYINDTSNDLSLYLYSDDSQSVIISAYYDLTIDADNDILIQRPTYFSGLINVTGPATFNSSTTFNNEVYINDTSNGLALYLYSDDSQSMIISAYYDLTIDADNDILIQRPTYFTSSVNVTGPSTFTSSVDVTGPSTFNDEVYINDTSNDLSLYLYSDGSQSVIISAYYDLTIDADNDILIQRPTYFSGLINVTGPATFNDVINVGTLLSENTISFSATNGVTLSAGSSYINLVPDEDIIYSNSTTFDIQCETTLALSGLGVTIDAIAGITINGENGVVLSTDDYVTIDGNLDLNGKLSAHTLGTDNETITTTASTNTISPTKGFVILNGDFEFNTITTTPYNIGDILILTNLTNTISAGATGGNMVLNGNWEPTNNFSTLMLVYNSSWTEISRTLI